MDKDKIVLRISEYNNIYKTKNTLDQLLYSQLAWLKYLNFIQPGNHTFTNEFVIDEYFYEVGGLTFFVERARKNFFKSRDSAFFAEGSGKKCLKKSDILVVSPINAQVFNYLARHPDELYHLSPSEFESVLAETYRRLGFKVQQTQATRDGGKDLILSDETEMGIFIYYVECKRYAMKNPVGIDVIRSMIGTVLTDRVNGGILATTSYFSKDSISYISENKYSNLIKLHDFEHLKMLLGQAAVI